MTDEESKKKILARRARFVAAAVASISMTGCGGDTEAEPQACLSDTGVDVDTGPTPCLTPASDTGGGDTTSDAGIDAAADGDADGDVDPDTGPTPCLAPPPEDTGDGG